MYELSELKIRRKAWVQASHINPNRLGWLLDDCVVLSNTARHTIDVWMDALREGEVVRASGNSRCGRGLLLVGEPGHGKTTIALSIIQEIMTTFPIEAFDVKEGRVLIRPCYFITFNDILELKGQLMGDSEDDEANILYQGILGECPNDSYNIRVLVIDDLGKEHSSLSGWQRNMFHHVLRTRFNNGLPTIVTSNIDIDNWAGMYGDATASFAHESFVYLLIKTSDLRKK